MSDFLSSDWFAETNDRLETGRATRPSEAVDCALVVEVLAGPPGTPEALSLVLEGDDTRVVPGAVEAPSVVIRLAYADAAAIAHGHLDSATALREGRLKVRGDVNVLVPLAGWFAQILVA